VTTKPRLRLGKHLLPGLAAVALFGVMAATMLSASFGDPAGFGEVGSITRNIGYAMFDIDQGAAQSEGFLVVFEVIDIVLVAALVGAVYLAKRDDGGTLRTALSIDDEEDDAVAADGGRREGGDD
jgi:NADH-quinone oxidoreductase subunit J